MITARGKKNLFQSVIQTQIPAFMNLFNKYILCSFCMTGTGNRTVKKTSSLPSRNFTQAGER